LLGVGIAISPVLPWIVTDSIEVPAGPYTIDGRQRWYLIPLGMAMAAYGLVIAIRPAIRRQALLRGFSLLLFGWLALAGIGYALLGPGAIYAPTHATLAANPDYGPYGSMTLGGSGGAFYGITPHVSCYTGIFTSECYPDNYVYLHPEYAAGAYLFIVCAEVALGARILIAIAALLLRLGSRAEGAKSPGLVPPDYPAGQTDDVL
jgi:hypothetical protein